MVPGGNYMFTLAEGVEWLRRAKLVQSMDAALATLADLQARCIRLLSPAGCQNSDSGHLRLLCHLGLHADGAAHPLLARGRWGCTTSGWFPRVVRGLRRTTASSTSWALCILETLQKALLGTPIPRFTGPCAEAVGVCAEGAPAVRRRWQRRGPQRRGRGPERRPTDGRPLGASSDRRHGAPAGVHPTY